MADYRFHHDESVEEAVRRIAADQLDKALTEIAEEDPHEAVHQARKRCKKIRALLRLVRGVAEDLYDAENAALRDAARRISQIRDAAAAVETADLLRERVGDALTDDLLDELRAALLTRRDERAELLDLKGSLAAVEDELDAARQRVGQWQVPATGFDALAGGLAKTYGRFRDRFADAYDEGTTEAFHEWRKRVKYHRYHVRLLQDAFDDVLEAEREALHDLSDLLGDDHDLAELREVLLDEPELLGGTERAAPVVGAMDRHRAELQRRARALARRLAAEEPDAHVARLRGYWEGWHAQGP